jgi:hypothetical protein
MVDASPVLFDLTPGGTLSVFEPSDKKFKEVSSHLIGASTYAHPVIAGNRLFVKDCDTVTLYTIK